MDPKCVPVAAVLMEREEYLRLLLSGYREMRIEAPEWLLTECAELNVLPPSPGIPPTLPAQVDIYAVMSDGQMVRMNMENPAAGGEAVFSGTCPFTGIVERMDIFDRDGALLCAVTVDNRPAANAGDILTIRVNGEELWKKWRIP